MATEPDPAELLGLAAQVAKAAGRLVHERRAPLERPEVARTKTSPTDVVTEADLAAERFIRGALTAARPDDAVLGEEGGSTVGSTGVRWIVDPIDGTVNYLYGLPVYAVSVAAQVDDVVVVGAVFCPPTGELWTARQGGGAFLNDRPVTVSPCTDISQALVATGFGYEVARRRRQAEVVARLLPEVRDIRRLGSAALDLCAVAGGRVDAYYEQGLQPWDLAAGRLIAEEAGAVVRILPAEEGPEVIVAAAPGVAGALLGLLSS